MGGGAVTPVHPWSDRGTNCGPIIKELWLLRVDMVEKGGKAVSSC